MGRSVGQVNVSQHAVASNPPTPPSHAGQPSLVCAGQLFPGSWGTPLAGGSYVMHGLHSCHALGSGAPSETLAGRTFTSFPSQVGPYQDSKDLLPWNTEHAGARQALQGGPPPLLACVLCSPPPPASRLAGASLHPALRKERVVFHTALPKLVIVLKWFEQTRARRGGGGTLTSRQSSLCACHP